MARPLKQGLSYFPLDVSFFDNHKIRNLRRRFEHKGINLLLSLYCEIYKKHGYYAVITKDKAEYITYEFELSSLEFIRILDYFFGRIIFRIA